MSEQTETIAVRKEVTVKAPPERAFAAFTEQIGRWWPLETHHIGERPAVEVVIEPSAGGRWFERAEDGHECEWGRVLAWEPPTRVLLGWELNEEYEHDPACASEVDVRFTATGDGNTRVELEHRGLEVYGDRAQAISERYGSPNGWSAILDHYARVAAGT